MRFAVDLLPDVKGAISVGLVFVGGAVAEPPGGVSGVVVVAFEAYRRPLRLHVDCEHACFEMEGSKYVFV